MSIDFNKQIDLDSIKKKMHSVIQPRMEEATKEILKKLKKKIKYDDSAGWKDDEEGISPYDHIGTSKLSYKMWDANVRKAGNIILAEFDNNASYAQYLYTKTVSVGHPYGFRSGDDHEEDARLMGTNGLYKTGKKRKNQLSFAKWMAFRRYMHKKLITDIESGTKKKRGLK